MLLVLDVGNTHIHVGAFEEERIAATWKISTVRERTEDELGLLLRLLLREASVEPAALEATAVACVVPPVVPLLQRMVKKYFGHEPFFVEPGNCPELLSRFEDPREVGADRVANSVAGFRKYGGPLIVVDFGTATTFDVLSQDGVYLGGAIAPGLAISLDALFRKAARLPRIELARPPGAVGTNTVASMQSGIIFGYAGLVDSLIRRIRSEIGEEAGVVATGGMATLIVRETGAVAEVDEHLTLEGIRILYRESGGAAGGQRGS